MDSGQADEAPYNPALRYGVSLLDSLVIMYGMWASPEIRKPVISTTLVLRAGQGGLVGRAVLEFLFTMPS
jgi:hypothetical protein